MRIVSRKELMSLPAGTVYSSYQPHVFNGLYAKGDTCAPEGKPIDWFMRSLLEAFDADSTDFDEVVAEPLERGEDVPLVFGECYGRDAEFNDSKQYAVWSKQDMIGLAKFLERSAGEPWPDAVEALCEENVKLVESEAAALVRETVLLTERNAAMNGAMLQLRTIVLALGGTPSEETNLVWVLKRIEELRK